MHEYGGRSYLPVPGGFVFANFADQRLYRCGTDGAPEPLTPAPGPDGTVPVRRFRPVPGGDEVGACGNGMRAAGSPARSWPSRWTVRPPTTHGAMRVLVSGSDFYAFPAPSPDGTRLAWICWDHPLMPWDGTELRVAALDGAGPADRERSR